MQQLIIDKLTAVEKEHGIRILYACESGSRGWQFPSPDSDYDVRFIYVRPYKYYLSVGSCQVSEMTCGCCAILILARYPTFIITLV